MLEFRILGPLEVWSSGVQWQIDGYLQQTLLIALLLSNDSITTTESLIDEMWGYGHPSRPDNALQAHVSRLRRKLEKLEPDRCRARLASTSNGYRLAVEKSELDGEVFVAQLRDLERRSSDLSADQLATRLREMLSAWRGPALGGVAGGRICRSGTQRYEQARLRAQEMLFDVELMRNNHAAIIAELSALVTTHSPYQERYCEQLMIALYRSGRQSDALNVFRRVSGMLTNDGLRPSTRLRDCEQAILAQNPILTSPEIRRPVPDRTATPHR